MQTTMNVLEVVEACGAGVGRHVRGLCKGLIAQGHQVTVAYAPYRLDPAFRQFMIDQGDRIRFFPLEVGRTMSLVSDLRSIVRVLRLVKLEGPFDLVHGHSSKGGAIARIAGRCTGTPTVYTPHSLVMSSPKISRLEARFYTFIERILGHWATSKFIAVSEDERDLVLKLRLTPRERITVIQNGIDDRDFDCFHEERTCDDRRRIPLTFGSTMRFSPQKAPTHLIEAFIQLNWRLPQLPMRLVIVGDGDLLAEAKRQVEASGLDEKIALLGWRTDVKKLLHEFDVFINSSLYEGFSYAVIEAMAGKLPVVSTNVFGTRETVAQVPGNILVPVGDPGALAEGMKRMATLVEYGSLRLALRKIGEANYKYARTRFRQSDVTRRTLQVYEELC
jgi:glycosyltransferase involved in cell wall biosynthesis